MPPRLVALVSGSDPASRRVIAAAVAEAAPFNIMEIAVGSLPASVLRSQPDLVVAGADPATAVATLGALTQTREINRHLPIILIVKESSEALAIAALRAGVTDYLSHPLDHAALVASARRLIESAPPARATRHPVRIQDGSGQHVRDPLIGSTPAMRAACDYLDRLARSDATVLITGETGTGKELAAHRLHDGSRRRLRPFVPVNCAAIPDALLESELFGYEGGAFTGAARAHKGLLERADGGTIFLDEIGDLGLPAQAKILRAIETREVYRLGSGHASHVDVRVVAATNHDLERAVDEQRFRKDLYFRLNVARVHLPPLRERRCDIPAIIDHYLHTLNQSGTPAVEMDPATIDALVEYDWPGNVRELKNLIEALLAVAPSGNVGLADLPPLLRARLQRYCSLPDEERSRIMDALFAADWNKSRAAEMLHWSRMTLYRKIAKYSVVMRAPCRLTSRER